MGKHLELFAFLFLGHTNVVELLLEHKSNIEHRNKAGCTPLMLASRYCYKHCCKGYIFECMKQVQLNTPS